MKKGTISRNISLLMEHFGIRNESQLAKQVGMPQTTVNKLMTGVSSDPRLSTLLPIIQHFKISFDTLVNENPVFIDSKADKPQELFIPIITYDKLAEVYDDLDTFNTTNWSHWYPIPQQKNKHYYAIHLDTNQLAKPFDQASLLIIQNQSTLQNNTYCVVKHLGSDSINIKKASFENGKQWLLALQSELPPSEFNQQQWLMLGNIQALVIDMTNGNFIFPPE